MAVAVLDLNEADCIATVKEIENADGARSRPGPTSARLIRPTPRLPGRWT
jgi:hypothetical protein